VRLQFFLTVGMRARGLEQVRSRFLVLAWFRRWAGLGWAGRRQGSAGQKWQAKNSSPRQELNNFRQQPQQ
jgi:hypothetical protein